MNLMDLFVKVAYDDKDVDKGIEETSKKGKGFAKTLSAAFKGTAAVVGAISTAAIAMGTAFVKSASDTAAYGDEVDKMSQKIGLSTEGYQKWRYVLGQSGGDINNMQMGMKTLASAAYDGSEAFEAIGISIEDAKSLSTEDLFEKTITQLSQMEAGTERTALATDLFGRSATDIMPMLNGGAESIEALKKQAEDYGLIMSQDAVNASVIFGDSVDLMTQTMTGMKNRMMSEFLPALTQVTDGLALLFTGDMSGLDSINSGISDFVDKIAEAIPQIITVGGSILQALASAIMTNMPLLVTAAFDLISQFAGFVLENLPMLIETALSILTTLAIGIAQQAPTLIPAIVQTVLTIINTLIDNLPLLLDAALQLVMGLAQGILDAIPVLIEALPALILSIIDFILDAIPQLIDAGIQLLTSLVAALPEIITAIVEAIPLIIEGIISAVLNAIPQIIQAGIGLLIALIRALPQIITTIVKAIPQIISGIVDALIGNIDKIIMAGVELFIALIENLPTIIVEIVKAVPQIISGIVEAFGSLMYKIVEIGVNLVKGIFNGISNAVSWLYGKLRGWVSSVLSYIKGLFGIKSPSTVMREEVGKMLAFGLGDGILKYAGYAKNAMAELMDGVMGETYSPTISASVNGSTGLYGAALAGAGSMSGVTIGSVNFNQPLQSTTQAAKLFARKLTGELYA